jgi:hypothetical protein
MAQRTPFYSGPGGTPDRCGLDAARLPNPGELAGSSNDGNTPLLAETTHRGPTPFVWQHGRRLLLLDDEQRGWVVAELRFDVERCRYVEVRRAVYEWPREAVGAVLSRALASGLQAAEESATSLHNWLSRYHGISLFPDSTASRPVDAPEAPLS